MISVLTGMLFLVVGAAVYHVNTHSHDGQYLFPGLNPDQTAAVLLAMGLALIVVGAARWLRANARSDETET